MDVENIPFAQALAETEGRRRHLLVGNGFSMAVHSGFGYRRLYDEAARVDPGVAPLFEGHDADFEKAIGGAAEADRARIRAAFIGALVKVHPRIKYIAPGSREACGRFLEDFAGLIRGPERRGRVFTTNYDLLLYWVLMHNKEALELYDGFDADLVWSVARASATYVFYLHGAVHHFESSVGFVKPSMEQWKLRWRESASLIEQVRIKVDQGHFPVFVSEGTSTEKRYRIGRNAYLKTALREFGKSCNEPEAAVFTIGHSLAAVDEHITDLIGAGSADVYLGAFDEAAGRRARYVAGAWAARREAAGQAPLRVRLFCSEGLPIWRPAPL